MPCQFAREKQFVMHKHDVVFVMAMLGTSDLFRLRWRFHVIVVLLAISHLPMTSVLGIVQASSNMFRKELVRLCHGRSISDVAPEYELPYTTVERSYYFLATNELTEEIATTICVVEFALRKGHHYSTSVLNANTGRFLAIVPHRNQDAITAALQKVTGLIRMVVSDFTPAMANAIQSVYPTAIHMLDRFYRVF